MNNKYILASDKNVTKYINKGITEDLKTNTRFTLYSRDGVAPNNPLARSQLIKVRKSKIANFINDLKANKTIAKLVIDYEPVRLRRFNIQDLEIYNYVSIYLVDRKANIFLTDCSGVITKWLDLMIKDIKINGYQLYNQLLKYIDLKKLTQRQLYILMIQAAGLLEVNQLKGGV